MKTLTIYCPNGKNWFIRIRNERNNKIVADGGEGYASRSNAIFAEGWYLACDWLERDDLKFDVDSPAFAADRAARLAALLTLLENNSDR